MTNYHFTLPTRWIKTYKPSLLFTSLLTKVMQHSKKLMQLKNVGSIKELKRKLEEQE